MAQPTHRNKLLPNPKGRPKAPLPKGHNFKPKKPRDPVTPEQIKQFKTMQERTKLRYQAFCREYIKDYNASAAMRRLGYEGDHANCKGSDMLAKAYVQWYLDKLVQEMDSKAIATVNMVLSGLVRESNYRGPDGHSSSRIAALGKLAKILGMEITKIEGTVTHNGGVMAVPFSGSIEDWERESKKAQAKLKSDVRGGE